jgi:hypothetical protein
MITRAIGTPQSVLAENVSLGSLWGRGRLNPGGPGSAIVYSTSGLDMAGVSAPINATTNSGAGGMAIAIVPVSAPVAVTVGAGGVSAFGNSGIGGAVLVEFVG